MAPLLGLLGTVVGSIGSFDIMVLGGIGQPDAVTGDVTEALTATAYDCDSDTRSLQIFFHSR